MFPALLISADAAAAAVPPIDGARLVIGDFCYAVPATGGIGVPRSRILRRVERLDDKRLLITVASRTDSGPLLTSRVEVAFPSLRPIRTIEETDGRTGLSVRYGDKQAKGVVTDDEGRKHRSTVPLRGPVWDDETMDFVLTTLPLADGAQFDVPVFHFARGPGIMRIRVRGRAAIGDGSYAAIDSWKVEGSTRSGMTITFFVAKKDHSLVAIKTGNIYSVRGGDCSDLAGK